MSDSSFSLLPRLLAIDSSTERLCLALQSPAGAVLREEAGGAQASARVVPLVLQMLGELGLTLDSLDAIAFARGPGAFTGLRTACAVAQGLALGAGKPVLPLDSLAIVAEAARDLGGGDDWWVAMDARMDEIYAGAYRWQAGTWQVERAPALYDLDTLHLLWRAAPPAAIAGSAIAAFGDRLQTGSALRIADELPRAAPMLRIATQAWQRSEAVDAAEALPLYLRDKVALTTAEREALKAREGVR